MMEVVVHELTGLGVLRGAEGLWLEADSELSECLMSRVVKRLDSIPRMWTIACLLVGSGCAGRQSGWVRYYTL